MSYSNRQRGKANAKYRAEDVELLNRHFDALEQVRGSLADELDVRSLGVDTSMGKQLSVVSDFLRGKVTTEAVAMRPDVLAFVTPLLVDVDQGRKPADAIAGAVRRGVSLLAGHGAGERKLGRVLLWPVLLTLVSMIGLVLLSWLLIGQFEKIYVEFGVGLPRVTNFVIWIGRVVRWYSFLIVGVAALILPGYLLLNAIGKAKNPGSPGMVDRWFTGRRLAVSRWLFHCSLLLEAGAKGKSFSMAADASGSRWLVRKANRIADSKTAFAGRRFATVQTGIELPHSPGKVAFLRQIATWYRDRSGNFLDWWVSLYVSVWGWLLIAFFFFAIVSLLMPLFAIISGLSGGGPGGIF